MRTKFLLWFALLFASPFSLISYGQEKTKAKTPDPKKVEIPVGADLAKLATQPPKNRLNLSGEAMAVKAHLESLMMQRYSQELSTVLNEGDFKLNFILDLKEIAPKNSLSEEDPNALPIDLQVANFSPEQLFNSKTNELEKEKIKSFLSQFSVLNATLSLGVAVNTDKALAQKAQDKLKQQFIKEFGNLGTFQIESLHPKGRGITDIIGSLQQFLGSLAIALAIIVGVWSWKGTQSPSAASNVQPGESNASAAQNAAAPTPLDTETTAKESNDLRIEKEMNSYVQKISDLSSQLKSNSSEIIKTWCEAGEAGYVKLACFAEAVGKTLGALPIPLEAAKEVTDVFLKMPTKTNEEKKSVLSAVYWDLLTVVNLGADSLNSPFSYLSTSDLGMIQGVLLEENDRLKTLVGIHMPVGLRRTYMAAMNMEAKAKLLNEAANLGAMPALEYRKINDEFKAKLSGPSNSDQIAFDMAFVKMAEGLNLIEEMKLLPKVEGAGMQAFKVQVPSLAFINEWPDDKLALVFSSAMPQEVLAYLYVRPDEKDRVLKFCPEMTVAVVSDELQKTETRSDEDLLPDLETLSEKIVRLVQSGEVKLKVIYDTLEVNEPQAA